MPTLKEEQFNFGGVDSRSNPSNFPPNRAIRCINYTPQASGSLRLRQGYTVPSGATADAIPIHSALYYEQFAAAYIGPQYVMYGKGTVINVLDFANSSIANAGAAGINTSGFTTSNPWGHFRANNRIFISDGVSNLNWDGTTLRVTGIPSLLGTQPQISSNSTVYAGVGSSSAGTGVAWVNPNNAAGPPDGNYAVATVHGPPSTQTQSNALYLSGFGFAIPTGSLILGIQVDIQGRAGYSQPGAPTNEGATVQLISTGYAPAAPQAIEFVTNATNATITLGGVADTLGFGPQPNIVNDPNFGVLIVFTPAPIPNIPFFPPFADCHIDDCLITITYELVSGVQVSVTASSLGSITPSQLSGYQLFAAIYNPITQHMGNCAPIGERQEVGQTQTVFTIADLPDLSGYNPEWEWAIGMTNDGGEVPYWFVDPQGNNIVLGNSATMGTVYLGSVNAQQELPERNDVPLIGFDKYARVGTRIFAGKAGNPFLSYSNDVTDITNADYVGIPEESWPADQQEPLPTGKLPTSIHAYRLEGWFFDRDTLSIWSQFLLQQGANPWRGPWPGGCPGQRAFIETPHGPFWINTQRQLCTFMEDGVISVSDEYEAALLSQLAYPTLNQVELGYLLDKDSLTDEIVIRGLDSNGNAVTVVHDFTLEDERSPHGQGYQYQYLNLAVNTFVGAGFTPRQNVYDTNGRMRLWAGSTQGYFAQLEDGLDDNGADFTGDYIGLLGFGTRHRTIEALEYQGDPTLSISYLPDYSLGLGDFIPVFQEEIGDNVQTQTRLEAKLGGEDVGWEYFRFQITAHPADGSYALGNPPFLPLPSYGCVNNTVLKLGAEQKEHR